MTVLPLPGLVEPPARPALARRVSTVGQIEKPGNIDALVAELRIAARSAADSSRAKSTERAYGNDWRDFCAFAHLIGRSPHPAEAETVALYVTDLARRGRAPATIARRLVSIAVYHRAAGYPNPTEHGVVRAVVSGLRRQLGVAQQQKTALEIDPLRAVLARIPDDVRGMRDRALLLIGWAAALRRSELAAMVASDLRFEPDGLVIELRRSKTDQEAAGDVVAVPFGAQAETCPVRFAHMAFRGRRRWRSLSPHRPASQHRLEPYGDSDRVDHSRANGGRCDSGRFLWSFTARRFRNDCSACRSKRDVDHAAWSVEKRSGRTSLHSTWFPLA